MKKYFVDTSFLVALVLTVDQNYARAQKAWRSLDRSSSTLITTSYVFDETATYLNSRGQHAKAIEIGDKVLISPTVDLVHVHEEMFFAGWEYFRKHSDKSYSLTDCISFLVMREKGADTALTLIGISRRQGLILSLRITKSKT